MSEKEKINELIKFMDSLNPYMMDAPERLSCVWEIKKALKELAMLRSPAVIDKGALKDCMGYVWREYKGMRAMTAVLIEYGLERVPYARDFPVTQYNWPDYGKTWRCWTQQPTKEQREAVPWNE
jgi:hypothetical protein